MPQFAFSLDKINNHKCAACIHSHKIVNGDNVYFECFPVKDYATRKIAINNCSLFRDTNIKIRDVYIAVVIYIIYPEFKSKTLELGAMFRGFDGTDDDLWKELKRSDFYDRVKETLPNIGYSDKTLFEPVLFAEREVHSNKWKQITTVVEKEVAEEIIDNLENNKNNND